MSSTKVITLYEPWASLLVFGLKKNETRSWRTGHRGVTLIHASARWTRAQRELCQTEPFRSALQRIGELHPGHIVGCADIIGCLPTEQIHNPNLELYENGPDELAFGDYAPGRYFWPTKGNVAFGQPVRAKGQLGFWDCDIPFFKFFGVPARQLGEEESRG